MSNRQAIPKNIFTDVLMRSRRRCCLCYGLDNDTKQKNGQIAHLDRNALNNSVQNLVWLCLEHHNQYDSRTSQSKGITAEEVRLFRDHLYHYVAQMLPNTLLDSATASQQNATTANADASDLLPLFRRIEAAVARIDHINNGRIEIVSVSKEWPRWRSLRTPRQYWSKFRYVPYPTGNPSLDEQTLIAAGFNLPPFFSDSRNETIALFCGFVNGFQTIEYYPIKYRTKLALIENEMPHSTLSGGTVLLANEGHTLYVHERSNSILAVHEAHGRRHSFCGSARVGRDESGRDADMSLRGACSRESQEESGESPNLSGGQIAIVKWSQQMSHGSRSITHEGFDVVYLGATVLETDDLRTRQHWAASVDAADWEGVVVELPVNREAFLREFATNYENWFPAGIAHHLIWLAIGAPNASEEFCRHSRDILVEILDQLDREFCLSL